MQNSKQEEKLNLTFFTQDFHFCMCKKKKKIRNFEIMAANNIGVYYWGEAYLGNQTEYLKVCLLDYDSWPFLSSKVLFDLMTCMFPYQTVQDM